MQQSADAEVTHQRRCRALGNRAYPATQARTRLLSAGTLAVCAPWPAAGPALALLQLLLGPTNAAFSGHLLLGILDPADELVAGQRRDIPPGIECRGVGDQCLAQVCWKLVHHPTGQSRAAHTVTVAGRGKPSHHPAVRSDEHIFAIAFRESESDRPDTSFGWRSKRSGMAETMKRPPTSDGSYVNPFGTGPSARFEPIRRYHRAFPDLHLDVEELIVSGDTAVLRAMFRGTDTGGPSGAASDRAGSAAVGCGHHAVRG